MNSPPCYNPETELELRCPIESATLQILRAFVETVARYMGFGPESIAQIEMAVDEACSNVLLHAYPAENGEARNGAEGRKAPHGAGAHAAAAHKHELIMRLALHEDSLSIWIIDRGVGSRSRKPHQGIQSIEEYIKKPGDFHGLGTYIIRSFMDEVEYCYPDEKGTIVRMKKYLRSCARI